jgi:predicted small metal-binding protein
VVSEKISLIYFHSKCASIGKPCSFMIKTSTFELKE